MSTPRRQEKSTTALTSSTDKFVCMDLDGSPQDSIRLCLVSNRRQEHTHLLKCHSTVSLALSWARYTFEDRHRFFTPVSPVWAPCTPPRWPLFLSGAITRARRVISGRRVECRHDRDHRPHSLSDIIASVNRMFIE